MWALNQIIYYYMVQTVINNECAEMVNEANCLNGMYNVLVYISFIWYLLLKPWSI